MIRVLKNTIILEEALQAQMRLILPFQMKNRKRLQPQERLQMKEDR